VGDVQMTVPSGNFLGYRLVKPRSRLVMAIECLRPLQTQVSCYGATFYEWKEACYAPNKITNHHFTLGRGWHSVCGIRNDRRTRRRRPELQAQSSVAQR
jgi:hypothetical protein